MSYDTKRKELAQKREEKLKGDAAARAARDEAELEAVFKVLDEVGGTEEDNLLHIPNAPPHVVGHVVVRSPNRSEVARFRAMISKPAGERGAQAARASASTDMAAGCVVYPDAEKYAALLEACPGVDLEIATLCHELARAGAEVEVKK